MRPVHTFLLLAGLTCPPTAQAQTTLPVARSKNIAVGNNRLNADSTHRSTWNIGLLGITDTLRGAQMGLLGTVTHRYQHGFVLGGLSALSIGPAEGVQVSGLVNTAGGHFHGLQLSTLSNVAHHLDGLQISGMSNIAATPMHGTQLALLTNIARGVQGLQFSAVANISSGRMQGMQAGAYNYADTLSGSQLGLINVAVSHPRGVQVGLFNYTRDTLARKLGLINASPRTDIDLMLFAGNTSKLNAALRFRNRSAYSLVGMGTHYMGLDKKFSGSLFYRMGLYAQLSKRWSVSGDVGYSHVETFEENSLTKPERLYSLHAHVNTDYRVGRLTGLYASLGYADTRRYGHHRLYEHKVVGQLGITIDYQRSTRRPSLLQATRSRDGGDSATPADSLMALPELRRPWLAAAEVVGINALVFGYDRFIKDAEYAHISLRSIRNNLETGFVWDNDPFSTNLFAHPYHGNLYFNAARSNGLSFWQSVPYAAGGSLMWELFAENEPPAINDWIATSLGGSCIGEIAFRVSRLLLNDRTRGANRALRETAALLVNPMQGLNRLLRGDAWRVRTRHYRYHDFETTPVAFVVTLGDRYLADNGGMFRGEHNPFVDLALEYGDALNQATRHPYDYFSANVTFGLSGNQPAVSKVHLLGRLWGTRLESSGEAEAQFGLYQHFNYYNSDPVKDGTSIVPYRISEAVGVGPGMVYRFPPVGNLSYLEQRIFGSLILLGGSESDYYNVIDRDYNMGSGFSFKSTTIMAFPRIGYFTLSADYYQIFSWKGYEGRDLENTAPLYYNVQGDRSYAHLLVLSPQFVFNLRGDLSAHLSGSYFARRTNYRYHDDVTARTFEIRAGLTLRL